MNYRHAYHAGNFADVFKHAALTLLLRHLLQKPSAFRVIDSHAGRGFYDLAAEEPGKTGEAAAGIGRLLAAPPDAPELADLLDLVRRFNPDWPALRYYPGSPRLSRAMLRPQDHLTLAELHPEEVRELRREFGGDKQVTILAMDAYTALKAVLPPPERRGLVLIDPPFEEKDEFVRITRGLKAAFERWPTGCYAIWYPIKAIAPVDRFLSETAQLGRPALTAEFLLHPTDDETRLNGCGLAILNPPWKIDAAFRALITALQSPLGAVGESAVRWLNGGPGPESTNH